MQECKYYLHLKVNVVQKISYVPRNHRNPKSLNHLLTFIINFFHFIKHRNWKFHYSRITLSFCLLIVFCLLSNIERKCDNFYKFSRYHYN